MDYSGWRFFHQPVSWQHLVLWLQYLFFAMTLIAVHFLIMPFSPFFVFCPFTIHVNVVVFVIMPEQGYFFPDKNPDPLRKFWWTRIPALMIGFYSPGNSCPQKRGSFHFHGLQLIWEEICLTTGAISVHFQLQYSPRIVKATELGEIPKQWCCFLPN